MTRIVAGLAKGRRLQVPRGAQVRPTADRVKEAVFSSLQHRLADAAVLDLYAGSGALGLEAASRGATNVVLVEHDRIALAALRSNVAMLGLDGVHVVADDVARVLQAAGESRAAPLDRDVDVAILDPPYRLDGAELIEVVRLVVPLLADGAIVVVERSRRSDAPGWPAGLVDDGVRRYGDTCVYWAHREI